MTPDSGRSVLPSGVRSLFVGIGALGAVVVVGVGAVTVFHVRPAQPAAHAAARVQAASGGLGLRAEVRAGSLLVSWNHDVAPVRSATSGSLTFQDGETHKTLQLSQRTARAGSVFYAARGSQVEVALTIFAPDQVVSESISAAVPAMPDQPSASQAGGAGTGSEVLVASHDRDVSFTRPEAEGPTAGKTGPSKRHLERRKPHHAWLPVRDHAIASDSSVSPIDPHEKPAPAGAPAPEVVAPDSSPKVPLGTVAIRVEVDRTGKVVSAVLIPQKDLDPAFAEAALRMARDWRFEASSTNIQPTTRILEFRQPSKW